MKAREILIYASTHPGETIKTLISTPIRQALVGCDLRMPPTGSTIEEYADMSLFQAINTTLEASVKE